MRTAIVFLICLIMSLPLAAIVYHDVQIYIETAQVRFSDLGWIWINKSPETMQMVRESIGEQTFQKHLVPLLRQTGAVITGLLAGGTYLFFFVLKLFDIWPFRPEKKETKKVKIDMTPSDSVSINLSPSDEKEQELMMK